MDIHGFTAAGFDGVTEAFARNFTERGEAGAAFAAYRHGELVVDLWGGLADPDTGAAWRRDTLQLIFSGAKGLVAACVLLLAERGQVDLEAPVARYWPEFAAAGKERITLGEVMSHQSRLPGIGKPVTTEQLLDSRFMAELLAAQEPSDDPLAGFVYHALTYGWLAGEVVRRVDGREVGAMFAEEFARPLGLDLWIGLPAAQHGRVATMLPGPGILSDAHHADPLRELTRNPLAATDAPDIWNSAEFRSSGMPAVGAFGTARSIARFYACLAQGGELDGVRVLKESTVERGRLERRRGISPLWDSPMAYGTGFELNTELGLFGPEPDAFGHAGAWGSRHGAWPSAGVGFSYAMNQASAASPDPRPLVLLAALHQGIFSGITP